MGRKPHAKREVVRYALVTLMDNAITQWRQLLLESWPLIDRHRQILLDLSVNVVSLTLPIRDKTTPN